MSAGGMTAEEFLAITGAQVGEDDAAGPEPVGGEEAHNETWPEVLRGLAGKLAAAELKAARAVDDQSELPEEDAAALTELLRDLGEAFGEEALVEAYADPTHAHEATALVKLVGRWMVGVRKVAEDPEGIELATFPLPPLDDALAFLEAAEGARTDAPSTNAARIHAMHFLERSGLVEAVLGRRLLEGFDKVHPWLRAASEGVLGAEALHQPPDEVISDGRVLLMTLKGSIDRVSPEALPDDLGAARDAFQGEPGAAPAGLPESLLAQVPAAEAAAPESQASTSVSVPIADLGDLAGPLDAGPPAVPAGAGGGMGILPLGGLLALLAAGGLARALRGGGAAAPGAPMDSPDRTASTSPGATGPPAPTGTATQLVPDQASEATDDASRLSALPGWLRGTLAGRLPPQFTEVILLASGGMGSVLRAEDGVRGCPVAIKVTPPHLADVEEYRKRFYREAAALARLDHPHIARVLDIPAADGGEAPLMVMEFLDGKDLAEVLEERGAQPVPRVVDWLRQAGEALAYVHEQGMLHRDVKPANLFLVRDGTLKLVDFGLVQMEDMSRMTRTGAQMGSFVYMPPEQQQGLRVDATVDQYALAASAYQLLTGDFPFALDDHLRAVPPDVSQVREEVPLGLSMALQRAMSREPGDRFESVRDFLAAL